MDVNTLEAINAINLPTYTQNVDHPIWVGSENERFKVSAAYDLINKEDTDLKGWNGSGKSKCHRSLKLYITAF